MIGRLIELYVYVIFARILLSWFPLQSGGAMASIYNFLYTITEPVLGPVRRVIPPLGGFDLSPIVVVVGLEILSGVFR